jgi:exo-beta-1,3-glucanase (GH17 family)
MTSAGARVVSLLVLAAFAVAAAAYWIARGIPVEMAAAPVGRISCVSYAPFRKPGESPFTLGYLVTPERIDEDLKALSRRFDCVRTYSVGQGLDQVPAIARRYGMKVLLGVWLSRNALENEEELALATAIAKREHDVIRAIVVGNEVLLRGELPQRTIATHLRAMKAATGLPVTYADVWEFWLKYREVAPAVDFITIHILPYWEDEPVAVEYAVDHVDAIYRQMQAAFPGRDFLIGETGWPSEGRQRWRAVPSLVNEARFFREFMAFVERVRLPYNVIEAFDQPWKRKLEGTVGGYWGLYDDDLRDKFPLSGTVTEDARWWRGLVCGGVVAIAFVAFGFVTGRRAPGFVAASSARALAGFATGAIGAAQVAHFVHANRDVFEWILMPTVSGLAFVTAAVVFERVARSLGQADSPGSMASMAQAFKRGGLDAILQSFWLVAITIVNLLLVFDARYRDFPTLLFAPPIVAFATIALLRRDASWTARREIEERLLVGVLVVAAAVLVVMELPINLASDLWAVLCLVFAAAAWTNVGPSRGR